MSTPEQPETPPLTRRQLREIRNTGATPVLTPEDIARGEAAQLEAERAAEAATPADEKIADEGAAPESAPDDAVIVEDAAPVEDVAPAETAAPEEVVASDDVPDRDATVAETPSRPVSDERIIPGSFSDLAVAPLTRRQAREHERIRTASVPIIAPDAAHAHAAAADPAAEPAAAEPVDAVPVEAPLRDEPVPAPASKDTAEDADAVIAEVPGLFRTSPDDDAQPAAIVNPHFGSGLLAGETPAVDLPPSFDQLISRTGATGVSSSTPNALILSQTPAAAPLVAPVTATGEVLITGTFDLPEGLGSVGHAPGLHDGKDVDAVLVDGELPAASSPTPIAASAAISQVRNSDEIIRPPAPEKGGGLVVALIITAGVALVAAVGVLVLAFTTGGIF